MESTAENPTCVIRLADWKDRFWRPMYACGHKDVRRFELKLWGQKVEPSDEHLRKRQRCGACTLADAERTIAFCAWCSDVIQKGSAVSLCVLHEDMKGPQTFVMAPQGVRVVCCLNVGCAPGMDAWAGNWDEDGVHRPRDIAFREGIEIKPDMQGELYPRLIGSSASAVVS